MMTNVKTRIDGIVKITTTRWNKKITPAKLFLLPTLNLTNDIDGLITTFENV